VSLCPLVRADSVVADLRKKASKREKRKRKEEKDEKITFVMQK
jgi:hypothetical protein